MKAKQSFPPRALLYNAETNCTVVVTTDEPAAFFPRVVDANLDEAYTVDMGAHERQGP